ncbi:cyclic pyranopterin monophosphate synthase MoaC [Thalassoglobus neptunius]|nr:cyclic pyranopterin monophosphate synthase MoaC [Thalassoglobus neptunius]
MTDSQSPLTHFDEAGQARMVDVGQKPETDRMARAEAFVEMDPSTLQLICDRKIAKGDVFEIARLAGIMATKRTPELIPLCHALGLDSAHVDFEVLEPNRIRIESAVTVHARTGVEMEALTAVSVAGLTIYDMCKSVDRGMSITNLRLLEKQGGKSGHFLREEDPSTAVTQEDTTKQS